MSEFDNDAGFEKLPEIGGAPVIGEGQGQPQVPDITGAGLYKGVDEQPIGEIVAEVEANREAAEETGISFAVVTKKDGEISQVIKASDEQITVVNAVPKAVTTPEEVPEAVETAETEVEHIEVTAEVAVPEALPKHDINEPIEKVVDIRENPVVEITTYNFGKSANGTYTDPNNPASVWYRREFLGHGLTEEQVLEILKEKDLVDESANDVDLLLDGNDLIISVDVPGVGPVEIGRLNNVEGFSGKATSGKFDVIELLKAQEIDISSLDPSQIKLILQEVGAGNGSLDGQVSVVPVETPEVPQVPEKPTPEEPVVPPVVEIVPETPVAPPITIFGTIPPITITRNPNEELAFTGGEHQAIGSFAAILLSAGIAVLRFRRRREVRANR